MATKALSVDCLYGEELFSLKEKGEVMIAFIGLIFSGSLWAGSGDLPKRFDMQKIDLETIPYSQQLTLKADFKIPDGYKSTYPPELHVYEKLNNQWVKIQTLKEDGVGLVRLNNKIAFKDQIKLTKKDSPVAFDLSVAFCKKACFINNFQGVAKRSQKAKSSQVQFNLVGFLPQQRVKEEFKLKGS